MADKTELRMNLAAVKRVDPYAKDIVDSSAHVAFYTFNSEENEWEKTDVEGVFFIYSRNAEPLHSIFINNRLNTNSFIEPITGQLELQSQPPFLLYRNERSRIRGFWFYNSSECDRIGELVGRLIKECETTKTTITKNQDAVKSNSNNVDIFTMLSKAQEDFNMQNQVNRHVPASIPIAATTTATTVNNNNNNNQPDVTSQSVMNFFAAAKPAAASEVPFFQRLMSKPVPVDQIEKQQRATTPQDGRMTPPASTLHHNLMNLSQQHHPLICNNSVSGIESAINLMNINSPKPQNQDLGTSPLAKFLGTSGLSVVTGTQQHRTISASEIENSQRPLQQLLRKESAGGLVPLQVGQPPPSLIPSTAVGSSLLNSSSNKPALMPPTMFLSSSSKTPSSSTAIATIKETPMVNCIQRQHSLSGGSAGSNDNSIINPILSSPALTSTQFSRPEPLTQTQLIQAMTYMIQNDPEFVKKLHEAYLKSFTEMVSL